MTATALLRALSAALDIVESSDEQRHRVAEIVIEWDSRGRRGTPGDGKWFCACGSPHAAICPGTMGKCLMCGLGRPK